MKTVFRGTEVYDAVVHKDRVEDIEVEKIWELLCGLSVSMPVAPSQSAAEPMCCDLELLFIADIPEARAFSIGF